MNIIEGQEFGGERPLYACNNVFLKDVTIHVGESSVKECRNVTAVDCRFEGKYVFWENNGTKVSGSYFAPSARSSVWYSRDFSMRDCKVDAPKMFRRVDGVDVQNCEFTDGQETLWDCRNVRLADVSIKGCDYLFMHSSNIEIENYRQDGNYSFQYARNVEIRGAVINSKDAFWEAENVTIYDSEINGEYLGWYAKNLRLVRCHLTGEQLLCYVDGLVLEDCTFGEDANLLFEYSSVRGSIKGGVTSIKNPASWDVDLEGKCGEWIWDENKGIEHGSGFAVSAMPVGAETGASEAVAAEAYDFDIPVDRRGTSCVKWDAECVEGAIPMWVADMDFAVAPCIQQALKRRIEHPVYGYATVPDSYFEAVIGWFERRHGWSMKRDWIMTVPGVVPAISAILKAVTKPGEKVLCLTPAYNCFFSSVRNNGLVMADVPLVRKEVECSGSGSAYGSGSGDASRGAQEFRFEVDWEAFEAAAADPLCTAYLLCNPHNPCGRVWTRDELLRMAEICRRNGVFVLADEIHCELVMPGCEYTPYGTLGEQYMGTCAICTSATKAFNIAGLQISNITVPDEGVRARIDRAVNDNEVCDVNAIGIEALPAAYNEGAPWLDALNEYLWGNFCYAREYLGANAPALKVTRLEGTYLMWVDVSAACGDSEAFCERIKHEAGVYFAAGIHYGTAGEGYIRINLACPRSQLATALEALATCVKCVK